MAILTCVDPVDLIGANLSNANLSGANLTEAIFSNTNLDSANISDVIGLDTIRHQGPTQINAQTIYNCQGHVSELFLRRCNAPEAVITLARSLGYRASSVVQSVILPSTVFISYSRQDHEFVDRIETSLHERGISTWMDRSSMTGGEAWVRQIQEAIRACEMQIVVLFPQSVQSNYVQMEYVYADQLLKFIIPLQWQPCEEIPLLLVTRQFVDFAHTPYDDAVSKLVDAITRHRVN